MDSAGVGAGGEYAEAYDLPLVVDAEGGEQIPSVRECREFSVEELPEGEFAIVCLSTN